MAKAVLLLQKKKKESRSISSSQIGLIYHDILLEMREQCFFLIKYLKCLLRKVPSQRP